MFISEHPEQTPLDQGTSTTQRDVTMDVRRFVQALHDIQDMKRQISIGSMSRASAHGIRHIGQAYASRIGGVSPSFPCGGS